MKNNRRKIKYKILRILLDNIKSILNVWAYRFSTRKATASEIVNTTVCISMFNSQIKERGDLNEINSNRINNMRLCCELINDTILQPGEIFSLRKIVGEVTEEQGFKEGPILIDGKLCFSIGGGLCQISTTLFNGALLANMGILEKYNHTADIWGEERFIDLGRDAVYVYALKDLKFRNNLPEPVIIKISIDEDRKAVICKILSKKELDYVVSVETKIIKEISPEIPKNTDSSLVRIVKGWTVLTKRYIEQKGAIKTTYEEIETYNPSISYV